MKQDQAKAKTCTLEFSRMSSVRVEYHQRNCETLERKPLDEARDKEAKGVQHVGAI